MSLKSFSAIETLSQKKQRVEKNLYLHRVFVGEQATCMFQKKVKKDQAVPRA